MQHTHLLAEAEQNRLLLRIYDLAKTFAPGLVPKQDVEDLIHDVILESLIKLRSGDLDLDEDRSHQLVRRMAKRQAIDLLRRRISRAQRYDRIVVEGSDPRHIWMSPVLGVVDGDYVIFMRRTMARVPAAWQQAHAMVRDERLKYEQVAARLGI